MSLDAIDAVLRGCAGRALPIPPPTDDKLSVSVAACRLTLLVLAEHANRDGVAFPSAGTIAAESGLGERTVRRALDHLAASRLIELTGHYRGRVRRYRVLPGILDDRRDEPASSGRNARQSEAASSGRNGQGSNRPDRESNRPDSASNRPAVADEPRTVGTREYEPADLRRAARQLVTEHPREVDALVDDLRAEFGAEVVAAAIGEAPRRRFARDHAGPLRERCAALVRARATAEDDARRAAIAGCSRCDDDGLELTEGPARMCDHRPGVEAVPA